MASILQSADVVAARPGPNGDDVGTIISVRGVVPITAALVINDLLECVKIPPQHILVDAIVDCDDLDTNGAPLITFDVGIMSGFAGVADSARTVGTEILAASALPQTGGLARATAAATAAAGDLSRQTPVDFERSVGILVKAAPATAVIALTNMNVNRGFWQPVTVYTANDFITIPDGRRVKCTTGGTSAGATSGQKFPPALVTMVKGETLSDGSVTWTMSDPYAAVTVFYRAARYGY